MLAVRKQINDPETNARTATLIMTDRLVGARVLSIATNIPKELGFANPQIAYVVIAELRN